MQKQTQIKNVQQISELHTKAVLTAKFLMFYILLGNLVSSVIFTIDGTLQPRSAVVFIPVSRELQNMQVFFHMNISYNESAHASFFLNK